MNNAYVAGGLHVTTIPSIPCARRGNKWFAFRTVKMKAIPAVTSLQLCNFWDACIPANFIVPHASAFGSSAGQRFFFPRSFCPEHGII